MASVFPELTFVVEDLPLTIKSAKACSDTLPQPAASRVTFQTHDFFQPQPINNADVYLLRTIIHDWPDADARKILQNLAEVLQPGSWIIVSDIVLPSPGSISRLQEAIMRVRDLTMIQSFNSGERDMDDWQELVANIKPALEIVGVQQPQGSAMSILHIRLAAVVLSNDMRSDR